MTTAFDHDYPPGEWTADGVAGSLSRAGPADLPRYEDRETWRRLRTSVAGEAVTPEIVAAAEELREEPMPSFEPSSYLTWRDDEAVDAGAPHRGFYVTKRRLSTVALAECLEGDGRFLDDVLDHAWASCEHSTWLHPNWLSPAQDADGLPRDVEPADRLIDLRSAGMARLLATIRHVFADALHPALRERILAEVERRVIAPYEEQPIDSFFWGQPPYNNWNAVCNGGVGVAALYLLDDGERVARIVAAAAESLGDYLDAFDGDGCTPEGIGYWNYGVRYYVQLAAALEAATDGEYSLAEPPIVREIARFPLRSELSPHRYPPFSDSSERTTLEPSALFWLGDRFDEPGLVARGRESLDEQSAWEFPETVRALSLADRLPTDVAAAPPDERDFFAGCEWWIARDEPGDPLTLSVAAKGGTNDESHNHNDCGSFVVHHDRESVIPDLGSPDYDSEYWERRYEYLAARSLGHSVPYVNGCEQAAGEEYAARVVDREERRDRDAVVFELADCYPAEAGLESLRRRVTLERADEGRTGRVTLRDEATFRSDAPGSDAESILVAFDPIDVEDGHLRIEGDRTSVDVRPDSDVDVDVERIPEGITKDADEGGIDVWRARLAMPGADPGTDADLALSLTIAPRS